MHFSQLPSSDHFRIKSQTTICESRRFLFGFGIIYGARSILVNVELLWNMSWIHVFQLLANSFVYLLVWGWPSGDVSWTGKYQTTKIKIKINVQREIKLISHFIARRMTLEFIYVSLKWEHAPCLQPLTSFQLPCQPMKNQIYKTLEKHYNCIRWKRLQKTLLHWHNE